MPPPGRLHGTICFLISRVLGNYLFEKGTGSLCTNDTGLLIEENPDSVRGPDIMLFMDRTPLDEIGPEYSTDVPNLVVEVLSPRDSVGRMNARVEEFLARGVPLVWLVDPEERAVTVYRPNRSHHVHREGGALTGEDVLPDFTCRIAELFTLPGQGK